MNEAVTTTSDKLAKTGNFIKSLMWKILFFAVIVNRQILETTWAWIDQTVVGVKEHAKCSVKPGDVISYFQ